MFVQHRTGEGFCHCCGSEDHMSLEYPEKGAMDKKDWVINKMVSACQEQHATIDNKLDSNNNTSVRSKQQTIHSVEDNSLQ